MVLGYCLEQVFVRRY